MDFVILGTAQDGGIPHAGCACRRCAAAAAGQGARLVSSAAVVDPSTGAWCLIDPSPDFPMQFGRLALMYRDRFKLSISSASIFVTHIHLGHYWGLGFLGKEGAAARDVPVFAGPRAAEFLARNDPFRRMVSEGRIRIVTLAGRDSWRGFAEIEAVPVRHRDDFSETFGFLARGPASSVFFMPDADSLDDAAVAAIEGAGRAYVDGTFYSADEIPGLSNRSVPHPPMTETAEILGPAVRAGGSVRFTHLNHTNPALDPGGPERKFIEERGFGIAEDFEKVGI